MNPLTIFAALLSVVPEAKAAMGVNDPCYALGCSNGDGLGQHKNRSLRPGAADSMRSGR